VADGRAAAGRPRGARPASRGPRAGSDRLVITHEVPSDWPDSPKDERADVTTDGQVSLSNGKLQRKRTLQWALMPRSVDRDKRCLTHIR
jgi:hypothetical protein